MFANIHMHVCTCLICQQQQYADKILSHVGRDTVVAHRSLPVCQMQAAQFPIRFQIWRAPKNVGWCACVFACGGVRDKFGRQARIQLNSCVPAGGGCAPTCFPSSSCSFMLVLFFIILRAFFRQATFQLFPLSGVAAAANFCVCVCVWFVFLFSHHFELFVVVISRCVARRHQLGLPAVIAKVTVSLIILEQNLKIKKLIILQWNSFH